MVALVGRTPVEEQSGAWSLPPPNMKGCPPSTQSSQRGAGRESRGGGSQSPGLPLPQSLHTWEQRAALALPRGHSPFPQRQEEGQLLQCPVPVPPTPGLHLPTGHTPSHLPHLPGSQLSWESLNAQRWSAQLPRGGREWEQNLRAAGLGSQRQKGQKDQSKTPSTKTYSVPTLP